MGLANRLCEFAAQLGFVLELHLAEIVCIPQRLDDFETICRCCKPLDYELFRQNISSIGSNRTLKSVKQSLESRYQLLKSQVASINPSERLLRDRYVIHEKMITLEEMESKKQALVALVYHLSKIGNELRVCNILSPEISDLDSVLIEVNGTCFAIKGCENNLLDIYNVHQSRYLYDAKESHVIGTLENRMAAASIQQLISETCCNDLSIFEDQTGHNRALAEIDSYFATELHRLSEINEINALELEFTEKRSEILEKSAALQAEFVRGLDLQYESLKFVENINTEINEINLASSKYEKKISTLFKTLTELNEVVPECAMRKASMPETCDFDYCWNSFAGMLEIKKRLGRSPVEGFPEFRNHLNLLRVEIIELEAQNEKNAIRITDLLSDTKNKRLGLEGTISLAKNEDEKLAKQTLPCIEKAVKDISECKKLLKLLQQQNEFEYVSLTKEVPKRWNIDKWDRRMMERDSRMTGNVNRQLVFSTNEAEIKAPEQFGRNSAWELEHFY